MMLVSECCGVEPDYMFSVFENVGICSKCLEHCDFKEEDVEDD